MVKKGLLFALVLLAAMGLGAALAENDAREYDSGARSAGDSHNQSPSRPNSRL